jgi:hypothetical protein
LKLIATANTAEDRAEELLQRLEAGDVTVAELEEAVELLAMTGTTLSGEQPERIKVQTRH